MNASSIGATSPAMLSRFRVHRRINLASLSCSSFLKVRAFPLSLHISSSVLRRPRGRNPPQDQRLRQKSINPDRDVEFTLDLDDISARTLASIKRIFRSSEAKIDSFFASGAEAYNDLKTSFRIDRGSRIVFSCRRSSVQFFGNLFLWSFLAILALRFLLGLWSFRHRLFFVGWAVKRRDRSLGGREVVVGRKNFIKGLVNPLSTVGGKEVKATANLMNKHKNRQEKLPKWWPDSIPSQIILFAKDEGQRDADKLVKAIMDNRISGKDYKDDDIIQMVAELMATFIMMFIGCSSIFIDKRNNITFVAVAFTWTSSVIAMGYTFGHISGCHMNPAVTIGFASAKLFPWKQVPFYVMAQVTGSTIACLVVYWLFNGEEASVMLTLPGGPNPVGNLQAVVWEIIISSILMLAIRGAGTDPRAAKQVGGIAVAAVLFCNIIVAGKITGASMNPARSLAPAIVSNNFNKIWIYLISPVIGTIIGSTLYNFFKIPEKFEEDNMLMGAIPDANNNIDMESLSHLGNSMEIP